MVFNDKPQILEQLEDNISREIRNIDGVMLARVKENMNTLYNTLKGIHSEYLQNW